MTRPLHATIFSAPVSTRRRAICGKEVGICGDGIHLIQTEIGKVTKDIVDITGVQQAQAVTGPYDVIVRAEARNLDELGKLVVAQVQAVDGITRTLTCPIVHLG